MKTCCYTAQVRKVERVSWIGQFGQTTFFDSHEKVDSTRFLKNYISSFEIFNKKITKISVSICTCFLPYCFTHQHVSPR
jgi:hypothetical protein